jgi:hypothetical protein
MLGAFRSFLNELENAFPYSYRQGDFWKIERALEELSVGSTEGMIMSSDMAVHIVRKPADLVERLLFLQRSVLDEIVAAKRSWQDA